MTAYYNEIDPYAAQWLRNLIEAGHIARGDVDERSIRDVRDDDLRGYTQCHFFAGIGGWSIALRLADWPDDRPVWTGSCPCQPFSAAGAGKAFADDRHLWPAWFSLIAKCGPPIVFGEQVEAAVGWGWLDTVFADLEGEGYTVGASVLPACGIGAPHIRQRLWFMADSNGRNASAARVQRSGEHGQRSKDSGTGGLALTSSTERGPGRSGRPAEGQAGPHIEPSRPSDACDLADAAGGRLGEFGDAAQPRSSGHDDCGFEFGGMDNSVSDGRREIWDDNRQNERIVTNAAGPLNGFWSDAEWIACTDGKARPVGPGSFPLGHGIQRRASKLRAYGNAIVPQVAAEFIRAAVE